MLVATSLDDVMSAEDLYKLCGSDLFAIQAEITALQKELGEVETEVKQEQYLRGYKHASMQTDKPGARPGVC